MEERQKIQWLKQNEQKDDDRHKTIQQSNVEGQIMIYKTLHRILQIVQNERH